jgi:hypothetical protein
VDQASALGSLQVSELRPVDQLDRVAALGNQPVLELWRVRRVVVLGRQAALGLRPEVREQVLPNRQLRLGSHLVLVLVLVRVLELERVLVKQHHLHPLPVRPALLRRTSFPECLDQMLVQEMKTRLPITQTDFPTLHSLSFVVPIQGRLRSMSIYCLLGLLLQLLLY